jgi:micrococcal nuclease
VFAAYLQLPGSHPRIGRASDFSFVGSLSRCFVMILLNCCALFNTSLLTSFSCLFPINKMGSMVMFRFIKLQWKMFFCHCILCFNCTILSGNICNATESFYYAMVVRIIDGDTIEVMQKGKMQRIRIWGIDTPEWDQPYATQASQFMRNLLIKREVQVLPKEFDDYGRLVATIRVDGKNISEELIRSGLAWVHDYYCNEQICDSWKNLQQSAMSARRGLWNGDNPTAPWKWKKNRSQRYLAR